MMITNKVTVFYCSRLDCINLLLDENEHSVRNVDYEIKRQKAVEQEIVCEFIRNDPDKKDF